MEKEETKKNVAGKKVPKTIRLDEPISWGSETIKEVTLQPIQGKHLRKLSSEPNLNEILNIASKISGLSGGIFDEMASSDVMKVAEAVGELL